MTLTSATAGLLLSHTTELVARHYFTGGNNQLPLALHAVDLKWVKKAWKKSPIVERQPCPSSSRLNVTYPSGWTLTLTLNLCLSHSSPTMMKITSQGPSHLQPSEQRYWVVPCHILCRSALSTWDAATSGLSGTADKVCVSQQQLCQVIHAKGSQKSQENWCGDIDFCGWTLITPKVVRKKGPASDEILWEAWWFIGQMIWWQTLRRNKSNKMTSYLCKKNNNLKKHMGGEEK